MPWELNDVEQLLVTTISTAVGHARIYNSFRAARVAGQLAKTEAFVVFTLAPGGPGDVRGQKNVRLLSRPRYECMVVTKGSPTNASEAQVGSMDDALQALQGVAAGTFSVNVIRNDIISRESPGIVKDEFWTYRGGTYQCWVAGTND